MCEESKQPTDGAGLCPGYTISRAILADAVCLTRGDRFLTTDLTRESQIIVHEQVLTMMCSV
jgi:linoleate 10R-lipoxygenase